MKIYKIIVSILTNASTPFIPFAQIEEAFQRKDRRFKIKSGTGRIHGHIKLKGLTYNVSGVKITGNDPNANLAVFERPSRAQERGTPLHIYPDQDEVHYVPEGSHHFKAAENFYNRTIGNGISLSRKVPHAGSQVSGIGKMTVALHAAGKPENFFVTTSAPDNEPALKRLHE